LAQKNFNGRRKSKNNAEHEVAGWILSFVSGFLLLFAVAPFIFGVVSGVISAFLLGVFGFSVYPILVSLLIFGVFLIQGRTLAVSKITLLCVAAVALFSIFILHLALTFSMIDKPFNEYIALTFDGPQAGGLYTAGGVFFGILVYGIQSLLTPVISFVIFGLCILAAGFILLNRRFGSGDRERAGRKPSAGAFKKQESRVSAPVMPVSDRSLYVDKIRPAKPYASEGGSFSELTAGGAGVSAHTAYSTAVPDQPESGAAAPPPEKPGLEPGKNADGTFKSKAHETLFGGNKTYPPFNVYPSAPSSSLASSAAPPLSSYSSPYSSPYASQILPVYTSEPDIKPNPQEQKPRKIVHISDYGLAESPLLPEKDVESRVVSGSIVNGDILSRQIAEETRARPLEPSDSRRAAPAQGFAARPAAPAQGLLANAAYIPEKNIENQMVYGAIVNGDNLSRQIADERRPRPLETQNPYRPSPPSGQSAQPAFGQAVPSASSPPQPEQRAQGYQIDPGNYDSAYTRYDGFTAQKIQPVKLVPKTVYYNPEDDDEESGESGAADNFAEDAARFHQGQITDYNARITGEDEFREAEDSLSQRAALGATGEDDITARSSSSFLTPALSRPPAETPPPFSLYDESPPRRAGFSDGEDLILEEQSFSDITDLSETSEAVKDDYTGFYREIAEEKQAFEDRAASLDAFLGHKPAQKPARGAKPVSSNQIPIEKYLEGVAKVGRAPAPKPRRRFARYNAPPIDLLLPSKNAADADAEADVNERARILEQTLHNLKLPAKVAAITRGPAVTRYEMEMPTGIPVKKIEQFETDIEYYLACNGKIRLETPIPGKRAVGVEVPNMEIDIVGLRDIIDSKEFCDSKSHLALALGKDIAGANIVCELDKMPHLLIAGATGSGKSVCLNSVIMSIVYKSSPEDVRLILIDPKLVEFTGYKNLPHLLTGEIITDSAQAFNTFKWLKEEMDRRYLLFSKHHLIKNLSDYNRCDAVKSGEAEKLPAIVLIVDELAELMLAQNHRDLEEKIMSMSQKARAAGIHLILATQRPSVDVITGTIKANLPSRIAFSVKSIFDSRTILDSKGAEALLGRGDMLFAPIGVDDPKRVQGAFVTNEEVSAVIEYVKAHNEAAFDTEFLRVISARDDSEKNAPDDAGDDEDDSGFDPLMPNILKLVIETGTASTSFIQRRFAIGYARAARIMDQMEQNRFIGPLEGSKPRAVLATWELYRELFGDDEI